MQILGLLGMSFDAVVVEFQTFLLLFRLALAILCKQTKTLSILLIATLVYHISPGTLTKLSISKVHLWTFPMEKHKPSSIWITVM